MGHRVPAIPGQTEQRVFNTIQLAPVKQLRLAAWQCGIVVKVYKHLDRSEDLLAV